MNENDNTAQQGPPLQNASAVQPDSKKFMGISKTIWYVGGCGCLLIIVVAVIAVLLWFFGPSLFGGGDPAAAIAPGDSLFYANVDFLKLQSEELANITNVFQEIAGVEKKQTLIESMDDLMDESLGMTFSDDVLPWIGQYGAVAITDLNVNTGEIGYMVVVEARNKDGADRFIEKLTASMEDNQDVAFDRHEKNGITLFVHETEYDWEENVIIARAGKFIYFANSENIILESAERKKGDSLASTDGYKEAMAALPKNRMISMYISGEIYSKYFDSLAEELSYYGVPPLEQSQFNSLAGIAMSVSAEDVGIRFDFAISYNEDKISDFQKDSIKTVYKNPNAANLVSGDTFFFMGANSSQSPGRLLQEGSPLYTNDVEESLDLFDEEYGINVQEMLALLSGEFALAVGPSNDGLFAESSDLKVGLTLLASTNDEAGFNSWFEDALQVASPEMDMVFTTYDANFGKYELQELVVKDSYGSKYTSMFYGADNGYFILGTSRDILENGLNSKDTLASNDTYRKTWKAFSSGSVPYLYLDVQGLMVLIKRNIDADILYDMRDVMSGLEKIPVIALTTNKVRGYTQSSTLIIFVETAK